MDQPLLHSRHKAHLCRWSPPASVNCQWNQGLSAHPAMPRSCRWRGRGLITLRTWLAAMPPSTHQCVEGHRRVRRWVGPGMRQMCTTVARPDPSSGRSRHLMLRVRHYSRKRKVGPEHAPYGHPEVHRTALLIGCSRSGPASTSHEPWIGQLATGSVCLGWTAANLKKCVGDVATAV